MTQYPHVQDRGTAEPPASASTRLTAKEQDPSGIAQARSAQLHAEWADDAATFDEVDMDPECDISGGGVA